MTKQVLPGQHVPSVLEDEITEPGSFSYFVDGTDKIAGLLFLCPCGCGEKGSLDFRANNPDKHPSWMWDGNEDHPTLSPSVLKTSGCKWHGHLVAGVWKEC